MPNFDFNVNRPGLLVSVRSAGEARVALAGGANVIDVKEPDRGPLGAADELVVRDVVAAVGDFVPVSMAVGELVEIGDSCLASCGAAFVKFGLSGCGTKTNWTASWYGLVARLPPDVRAVAVAYADWRAALAPSPDDVLEHAVACQCPALLIDTWEKKGRTLFDHWPWEEAQQFCRRVRDAKLGLVLAGSLSIAEMTTAVRCRPHLIAVRGAACVGGRNGHVSLSRVRSLRAAI